MPYSSLQELPDRVKDNLPKHAQEIFKEAFNSAEKEYQDPDERRNRSDDPEEVAFRVAWSAVKEKYEKKDDRWVKKRG